jgi:uncharacterized protein with PIN domain
MGAVVDASALLALLQGEAGAEVVEARFAEDPSMRGRVLDAEESAVVVVGVRDGRARVTQHPQDAGVDAAVNRSDVRRPPRPSWSRSLSTRSLTGAMRATRRILGARTG